MLSLQATRVARVGVPALRSGRAPVCRALGTLPLHFTSPSTSTLSPRPHPRLFIPSRSPSLTPSRCYAAKTGAAPIPPLGEAPGEEHWNSTGSDCDPATSAPLAELRLFEGLRSQLGSLPPSQKVAVVEMYPELKDLLEMILSPAYVFDIRPSGLIQYFQSGWQNRTDEQADINIPTTLVELLTMLHSKRVSGHYAKAVVIKFAIQHAILKREPTEKDFVDFCRIFDRNLKAGFGFKSFKEATFPDRSEEEMAELRKLRSQPRTPQPPSETEVSTANKRTRKSKADKLESAASEPVPVRKKRGRKSAAEIAAAAAAEASSGQVSAVSPIVEHEQAVSPLKKSGFVVADNGEKLFQVALGNSIHRPFKEVFDTRSQSGWYASRKLDGVRCLTFLDFAIPAGEGEPWLIDVNFYSRTGKKFTSLENLARDLRRNLPGFPGLRELVMRDAGLLKPDGQRRLVLDGEVCVMRPLTPGERERAAADHGTAGTLWEDVGLTEDFRATVSQVKRMYDVVQHPAYFMFDVINWSEFNAGAPAYAGNRTFAERDKDVQALGAHMCRGGKSLVRSLVQEKIMSREQLDSMVERAAREGWEGLMLRKDTTYRARRSNNLLKYKQWQDAEYEVLDIETSRQRLAVNGTYAEYDALASVVIEHNGHRVSVGSGFTAEQKLRYRDPAKIVGKQVTVEYFGESEARDREEGIKSLRFPRIKQVWEEGKRAV